jgi:hypothetical protein
MDAKVEKAIVGWLNRELDGYVRECGSDYRAYITEDAIGEFVGWDASEEEKDEVSELCRKFLNGEYGK